MISPRTRTGSRSRSQGTSATVLLTGTDNPPAGRIDGSMPASRPDAPGGLM